MYIYMYIYIYIYIYTHIYLGFRVLAQANEETPPLLEELLHQDRLQRRVQIFLW